MNKKFEEKLNRWIQQVSKKVKIINFLSNIVNKLTWTSRPRRPLRPFRTFLYIALLSLCTLAPTQRTGFTYRTVFRWSCTGPFPVPLPPTTASWTAPPGTPGGPASKPWIQICWKICIEILTFQYHLIIIMPTMTIEKSCYI